MNTKQLADHKVKQEEQQDEALGELINIVKNTKQGGKAINQELKQQDVILDVIFIFMCRNWMMDLMKIRKIWVELGGI